MVTGCALFSLGAFTSYISDACLTTPLLLEAAPPIDPVHGVSVGDGGCIIGSLPRGPEVGT